MGSAPGFAVRRGPLCNQLAALGLAIRNRMVIGGQDMAARELGTFNIVRKGEDYIIKIEDKDGEMTQFVADYDALDIIAEAIEEALDSDEEEALEVDDDEELEE
ncbi:hypothetical protein [Novosphingobium sp. M1R2S20]|uniref:Uncharacterized protein n=1 Tax=Novosphingobium rhizovicinum TaxID=3228928 RepID=A0ABV3R6Y5_9SPHN